MSKQRSAFEILTDGNIRPTQAEIDRVFFSAAKIALNGVAGGLTTVGGLAWYVYNLHSTGQLQPLYDTFQNLITNPGSFIQP